MMLSRVTLGVTALRPATAAAAAAATKKRAMSGTAMSPAGRGGRSSVSGLTTTIFGCTGFLGRYVVNEFGKVGSQIIAPYRGDEHAFRHLRLMGDLGQVIFLDYQLLDAESVRKCVAHSNVVVNLVGQDADSRHFGLEDVNVDGARIIAEACAANGVESLIHVSSLNTEDEAACESSRYLASKRDGEHAVREAFPSATIMRPSHVFGPEDRLANRYAQQAKLPLGQPAVDGGAATKQPVYCGDVARAILQAATLPAESVAGQTFELVGPKEYSTTELLSYVNETIRVPDRQIPVPAAALMPLASVLEMSPFDPLMTREDVAREAVSDSLTGAPGLDDLDVRATALEEVSLNYLRRYRAARHHDEVREI